MPEPVDITVLPPGQNVCHVRLTWLGLGFDSALPGHEPSGTLLIEIEAVSRPVVATVTVGLPVTEGFVKAKAGWLRMTLAPTAVALPAASRFRASRLSISTSPYRWRKRAE